MTDNELIAEWLDWKLGEDALLRWDDCITCGKPTGERFVVFSPETDIELWCGSDGLLVEIEDKGWFWWCKFCVSLLIDFYNSGTTRPSFEWGDKGFRDLSVYDAGGFMKAIMRATPAQLTAALVSAIKAE